MTPEQRTAIYSLVPALSAVLVAAGVLTEQQAATVSGAVLAILGVLVAYTYRPVGGRK